MENQTNELLEKEFYFPIEEYFMMEVGGTQGFWLLFATIVILAMITYKLGFAKKLPLMKSLLVYIILIFGCFILILFSIFAALPIAEVLIITSIVLGIYRYRLHNERKEEKE